MKPTTGILLIFPRALRASPTSATVFCPTAGTKDSATDHHNCVVDRIEIFKQVLSDSNVSRDDHIEALKFLVHFVGDVHQPFHAIGDECGVVHERIGLKSSIPPPRILQITS